MKKTASMKTSVTVFFTETVMLIGLGLAESTPGPLIMVTQYVGFLGTWNLTGDLVPLTAGILGALITI